MKFIKLLLVSLCLFGLSGCAKKQGHTFKCVNENGCIIEIWNGDNLGFPIDGTEYRVMNMVYGQEKLIKFPNDDNFSIIIYLKTPVSLQGEWLYDIVKVTLYSNGTYEEVEVREVPYDYFNNIDSLTSPSY